MVPSVHQVFPNFDIIFQQDTCRIHTARRVTTWLRNHNINVIDWPSRSPDLNPIENMWGFLVQNLKRQRITFQNKDQLLTAITDSLPQEYHHMPLDAKTFKTCYRFDWGPFKILI
jgi:hypothetical protein